MEEIRRYLLLITVDIRIAASRESRPAFEDGYSQIVAYRCIRTPRVVGAVHRYIRTLYTSKLVGNRQATLTKHLK